MAEPFLSEIRIMSFNFAPKGWALCNGQLLPINQNQALFSLLGTTYGGNGQTNFALPNLRGKVPIHQGSGFTLGESAGQENHTITQTEMPQHMHVLMSNNNTLGNNIPGNTAVLSQSSGAFLYGGAANLVAMAPQAVGTVGGSQAHPNMQPYLTLNFCIALQGIFPSQS